MSEYVLTIEGPDAQPETPGHPEVVTLKNGTTACNMYARLASRNHVTLKAPNGHKIDSRTTPDPWGSPLG